MRELLIRLGIVEAEPREPSLPAWIYLLLGVIVIVIGTACRCSGREYGYCDQDNDHTYCDV
jgi:hypothetical protein